MLSPLARMVNVEVAIIGTVSSGVNEKPAVGGISVWICPSGLI
jgi:hypothetical protein